MTAEQILLDAAAATVLAWAKYELDHGRDPKEELAAMLDTADAVADAAQKAKFGE
jgi:hypothetical protein